MRRVQAIVGGVVAVMLATAVVEVKGGTTTSPNVTTELLTPAGPAPVFFSDAARSGSDTYVTTAGKNPVGSYFLSGGDWQLDTQSAGRAVWLDLADPNDPNVPFNAQYVHSLLTTHCSTTNAVSVAALNAVGSSTSCGMSFRINTSANNAVIYRIHFNSVLHPGTGDVKFTCNVVNSTSQCIDWTAVPADNDGAPDGRSTGLLVKVTSSKGTEVETPVGYYSINFQMHLTNP